MAVCTTDTKIDIIGMFCENPSEMRDAVHGLLDKMGEIYEEALQAYVLRLMHLCLDKTLADNYLPLHMFLLLLNEDETVVSLVKNAMPENLQPRLEVFLPFLRTRYNHMIQVHPTTQNVDFIMREFCDGCAMAWTCDRQVYMKRYIRDNDTFLK